MNFDFLNANCKEITIFIDDSYFGVIYDGEVELNSFRGLNRDEIDKLIKNSLNEIKTKDKEKTYLINIVTNSKNIFIKNKKDKFDSIYKKLFIKDYRTVEITKNSFCIFDKKALAIELFVLFKNFKNFKLKSIYDFTLFNSQLLKEKDKLKNDFYINISGKYTTIIYINKNIIKKRVIDIGMNDFENRINSNKLAKEYFQNILSTNQKDSNVFHQIKELDKEDFAKKELYILVKEFIDELKKSIEITKELFKNEKKPIEKMEKIIISGEIEEYGYLILFLSQELKTPIEIFKDEFDKHKQDKNSIHTTLNLINSNQEIVKKIQMEGKKFDIGLYNEDGGSFYFITKGKFEIAKDNLTKKQKLEFMFKLTSNDSRYKDIDVDEIGEERMRDSNKVKIPPVFQFIILAVLIVVIVFGVLPQFNLKLFISDSDIDSSIDRFEKKLNEFNQNFYNKAQISKKETNETKVDENRRNSYVEDGNLIVPTDSNLTKTLALLGTSKPSGLWITAINIGDIELITLNIRAKKESEYMLNMEKFINNLEIELKNYKPTVESFKATDKFYMDSKLELKLSKDK